MSTAAAQMSFFTIETLQFSKRMQKAGLDQKVSEELAEAIKETQTQSIDGLATKQDIRDVRQEVELLKKDIIIKLGGMIIFSSIAVASFLAWFLPIAIK